MAYPGELKKRLSRLALRSEPYVFTAPFYILFAAFTLYPVAFAAYVSLTEWHGTSETQFVGLANYARLVVDSTFHRALTNNIWFSLAAILLVIPLALLLAVALNQGWLYFTRAWRTVYFLPVGTSTVVIAMVFLALYDARYGTINWLLSFAGIAPVNWLGNPATVKPAIIGLITWRWVGLFMVYFLAGLQNIPRELYEAAMVDGATPIESFFYITIPMLRPVLLFVLVIVTRDSFRIFDEPFILNRFSTGLSGGPEDAGLSLALYLYRMAFQYRQLGFGSAVGMVIFTISFGVALVQIWRFGIFQED